MTSAVFCEGRSTTDPTPDLRRLVDQFPGMFFTSTASGSWSLLWVSAGCLALTGYNRAELLADEGWAFNQITFHEDRAAVFVAIQEAVNNHRDYLLEYRIRTKDGELKWVWERGHGVYDSEGKPVGLEGFITDSTALKLSTLSITASEQRLHSIFENTAEGIFQSSADGAYQKVNPALARIYGYESPEAMLTELTDIGRQLYVDPERRSQFVAVLERRNRISHFESEVWRRDGVKIWISENARAVRDENGSLLYYEGTVQDITERKAAQDALAKERNMLRTVIDAWPDIVYVKDTQGRYLLSNRAHTENLGMNDPSEIVGRKPEDFFLPSRAARLSEEDLELMRTGKTVINREEVRIAGTNEQRWFLCAKIPLYDSAGVVTGLVCLSRDLTEQKLAEQQLRQSQKMEAVGQLAGGVAHDFNNIMTAILGFSELIAMKIGDNMNVRQELDQIQAGAVRASALTQQLLAFSRKQVTLAKPLNLNQVITGIEPMLRRLVGDHIHFRTCLDSSIGIIEADLHQVEQVVMNLVINARDAVQDGGSITIETRQVYVDGLSAHQKLDILPGVYVQMAVCDDGCGIPKDIQERIFEPFFTTKEQGKGTGLGLATAYGIIRQNKGHICVQSDVGQGATFTVYLPLKTESGETETKGMPGEDLLKTA